MYRKIGISKARPKGYRPDPITFTTLSIKDVSCPEKGMYMYEPEIIYF